MLEDIVSDNFWFKAPFSEARLGIQERCVKLELTLEDDPIQTKITANQGEDDLLDVFYAIALRVFPSEFDFRSRRKVLVLGGAASGKTCLLKHIALLCANRQGRVRVSRMVHIPLLINLRELATHARDVKSGDLLGSFLKSKYVNCSKQSLLWSVLKSGNYWLLLDGLDEVENSEIDPLLEYISSLCRRSTKLRVVITSRHGKTETLCKKILVGIGFTVLRIRPLTTTLARDMVAAYLPGFVDSELFPENTMPPWLLSELKRPQYKAFRKSPLTLSLFVSVLEDIDSELMKRKLTSREAILDRKRSESGDETDEELRYKTTLQGQNLIPPYCRIDLFHRAIVKMFDSYEMRIHCTCDFSLFELFEYLAYTAHENKTRKVKFWDMTNFAESRGLSVVDMVQHLVKEIHSENIPMFSCEDRDDYLKEETLEQQQHQSEGQSSNRVSCEDDVTSFFHQTIQEHFAAMYIAKSFLRLVMDGKSVRMVPNTSCVDVAGIDYSKEELRERIKGKVERLMLGHFEPAQYRIAQEWWQPVILTVFDLLAIHAPPPIEPNGRTFFEATLQELVDSCSRMQQYNNGHAAPCLESFWLAAASFGAVRVAKGAIKTIGVRTLLQAVNGDWNNAMHLAAVHNQPEIIKLLMASEEVDADYLDTNNRHGWDPSNMAMVFNHTYCFRLLCCTDGDKIAEQDSKPLRPLLVDAAMKGDLKRTRDLLDGEEGENTDEDGTSSTPPLRENLVRKDSGVDSAGHIKRHEFGQSVRRQRTSERKKGMDIARICSSNRQRRRQGNVNRKKYVDVDAKGSTGMTAAMWAARNGHTEILDQLIKHGADIHMKAQGISTLIFAVESGHADCVKVLVDAGADAMDRTPDDDSSLLCACSFGFDDVAHLLIKSGASALEALVVSCVQGKDSTVRRLVETGVVNVNMVWEDLMVTPLAGACVAGRVWTVRLLLALGADPNVPIDVEYGSSPLMLACHMGNIEVVRTMIDAGADLNARTPGYTQCASANGRDTTAVSIARMYGHVEVEALLRERGAKAYVPCDLTFYEWLGGNVHYPLISPDFHYRLQNGAELELLLEHDEYISRVDLLAWRFLGGRTAGEAAWDRVAT
eukprot:CAMPEP_0203803092 /NCGR_PEP_ID=MMETSP0100_2-20121128/12584_1 /ASSEMBLY_ACC=CAM_ASM_000210 /TAXON_ID=96639 /ORGANISM=" , Strain NY0313808BC1" /LENGTH=1100 /DNA_ID=CAMNT_0050710655 /DNA_START=441 /DNA_END=3743 /DNA_ORIENTATION=+